MKVMDLYHHLSRVMYYDIDKNILIKDQAALDLQKKIIQSGQKIGWHDTEKQQIKADVWGGGKPTIIYGAIYEI